MNTKVQDPGLNGYDQHIPISFSVYILTLDSECQQIFFQLDFYVFACILIFKHLLHSEKNLLEEFFEYKRYRIMLVYLKTTSREEYMCQ